jgi:hypothetical protein
MGFAALYPSYESCAARANSTLIFSVILFLSGNLRVPALISSQIHLSFQRLSAEFRVNSETGNFAPQNRE